MKIFFRLILLTGFIWSNNNFTYLSPGLQFGIDSKGNIFTSTQITIGYVDNEIPPIGITFGLRWYNING